MDPTEEKKRAQEEDRMARMIVYSNVATFIATVAMIRITPYVLEKFF